MLDGDLLVQDLASRNGTYVNGQPCGAVSDHERCAGPVWLTDGDILTIGGTTLQVRLMDCLRDDASANSKPSWPDHEAVLKDCPLTC
jgi:pSer/pThr/pTyr-binding forkhead associated (FHA) protein